MDAVDRPLVGVRAVVTRARSQAAEFSRLLRDAGAAVEELPTIEIVDPEDWSPVDRALQQLGSYEMVIFTSVNGVERFLGRIAARGGDVRELDGVRLAAIGPATAAVLRSRDLEVEVVPGEYRAEAALAAIGRALRAGGGDLRGIRLLLPRALEARELLPEGLRAQGARVDVVPVYRTVLPAGAGERARRIFARPVDLITFTSSSTVRNFVRMMGPERAVELLRGVVVACIGPITRDTASEAGLSVQIQPRDYTIEGFHGAVVDYFRRYPRDR